MVVADAFAALSPSSFDCAVSTACLEPASRRAAPCCCAAAIRTRRGIDLALRGRDGRLRLHPLLGRQYLLDLSEMGLGRGQPELGRREVRVVHRGIEVREHLTLGDVSPTLASMSVTCPPVWNPTEYVCPACTLPLACTLDSTTPFATVVVRVTAAAAALLWAGNDVRADSECDDRDRQADVEDAVRAG